MNKIIEKILEPSNIRTGSSFLLKIKVIKGLTYEELKTLNYREVNAFTYREVKGE